MQLTMNPDWLAYVYAATDRLFATDLGPRISADAKAFSPKRTGELAESIEFHLNGHSLIVKAHAPYAAWVELGTKPHVILPRDRLTLRWFEGGEPVFARRVNHPGTHPEPYLRPALFAVRGAA